ncbi:hypothetical protein [Weizmannia phage Youna2]
MSEIKKETVLYDREKDGVSVVAKQLVKGVVVQEASEDKEAVTKNEREYLITATFNGEVVKEEAGQSYRQTIQRARKMFKELHSELVPKEEVTEAV